jgi:chorismate lyase / 3-hydroxybenzoate synthase
MSLIAPLDIGYVRAELNRVLADDDVLAVIGFGPSAPHSSDARYLRVGLQPFDAAAPFEVWRARGPVTTGNDGAMHWAADADYLFAGIEVDEDEHGGVEAASHHVYETLSRLVEDRGRPHLLRVWNYLAAINDGEGDAERYKHFCTGRATGMGTRRAAPFVAASAIGRSDGGTRLQVYALAARVPGRRIENPRQTSAWCYPRRYGPTSPTFARGVLAPTTAPQLYISGTAAVVGHASQHDGDVRRQVHETFANLESLFGEAGLAARFGTGSVLKAYVRHAEHAGIVAEELDRRLPPETARLLLLGDICRAELLVEIDGVHRGA